MKKYSYWLHTDSFKLKERLVVRLTIEKTNQRQREQYLSRMLTIKRIKQKEARRIFSFHNRLNVPDQLEISLLVYNNGVLQHEI